MKKKEPTIEELCSHLIDKNNPPYIKDLIYRLKAIALESDKSILLYPKEFNRALIGLTNDGNACYSYDSIIEIYMDNFECDLEEAIDYVSYNMLGVHYSQNQIGPIIVFS